MNKVKIKQKSLFLLLTTSALTLPINLVTSCATIIQNRFEPLIWKPITTNQEIHNQLLPDLIVENINNLQGLKNALKIDIKLLNQDHLEQMMNQKWYQMVDQNQPVINPNLALEWNVINQDPNSPWAINILGAQFYHLDALMNNDFSFKIDLKVAFYYQNQYINTKALTIDNLKIKYPTTYQFSPQFNDVHQQKQISNDDLILQRFVQASNQFNPEFSLQTKSQIGLAPDQSFYVKITKATNDIPLNTWNQLHFAQNQFLLTKLNFDPNDQNQHQQLINATKLLLAAQANLIKTAGFRTTFYQIKLNDQITKLDPNQLNLTWSAAMVNDFNDANQASKADVLKINQNLATNESVLLAQLTLLINSEFITTDGQNLIFNYPSFRWQVVSGNQEQLRSLITYIEQWRGQLLQLNQLINHYDQQIIQNEDYSQYHQVSALITIKKGRWYVS